MLIDVTVGLFFTVFVNGIDLLYISMRKINKSGILVAVVKWHHCENGFNVKYFWHDVEMILCMKQTETTNEHDCDCASNRLALHGIATNSQLKKTAKNSFSITWGTWNWADTKRSCDIICIKMKVIWFSLLGHILNKIIVIWFFKPAPFSKDE